MPLQAEAVALRLPFELFRLLGVAFKSPLYLRGATLKAPSLAEGVWGWVNSHIKREFVIASRQSRRGNPQKQPNSPQFVILRL